MHKRNKAKTIFYHLINEMKRTENYTSFTAKLMEKFLQTPGFPTFHVETRSFNTLQEKQEDVTRKK